MLQCLELYLTNSEFISLWHLLSCFHDFTNHFLKSPFLIQESITSTQAEPFHVLRVPQKMQSVERAHSGSGIHRTLSAPPCLSSLIHFSPLKCSPQLLSSHVLKSYPLKGSSQIPTIFFRMTSLPKAMAAYFISNRALNMFTLCCNYLNFSWLYPNQFKNSLQVSSVFSSSIVTAITSLHMGA